jgi:hypothetical protein
MKLQSKDATMQAEAEESLYCFTPHTLSHKPWTLSKADTSTVSSKHIRLQHHKCLPESEDWRHILKFVWREVPEFWQTALVQLHLKFLQSHQGTSPERLYTSFLNKFSYTNGEKWYNPNKKSPQEITRCLQKFNPYGVCPQAPDDGLQIWKVAGNTRCDQ